MATCPVVEGQMKGGWGRDRGRGRGVGQVTGGGIGGGYAQREYRVDKSFRLARVQRIEKYIIPAVSYIRAIFHIETRALPRTDRQCYVSTAASIIPKLTNCVVSTCSVVGNTTLH